MTRQMVTVMLAAVMAVSPYAQEKPATPAAVTAEPKTPALTDVQKLTLQNLAQRIELAQLRAQAAQVEFDKARAEISALVQSLQVPGYDLDLLTLTYTKKPPPVKPAEKRDQR